MMTCQEAVLDHLAKNPKEEYFSADLSFFTGFAVKTINENLLKLVSAKKVIYRNAKKPGVGQPMKKYQIAPPTWKAHNIPF